MTERPADLDVVVLGGGGHVGLAAEPRVRRRRPAGRHLRHQPGDPRPDRRAARCRSWRTAPTSSCARSCRPAASSFGTDGSIIERTEQLVVVIGTPVDEFLGPSMTVFERAVDQIAPHLRDGRARRPAQHRLPGHDRLRRPAPRRARLRRGRRVLPGADRRGPRARGAPHAAPDRRRRRRPRRPSAPTALFGQLGRQDDPDDDQGSRARQAVHEHLAVHEVRRREPVLHDRRPGRRGLHERPATRSARTTRGPRTCRVRASPPARACSRTRCSWRPSPATTSRWARPRCRSTRACPPTSSRRWSAATAASTARRSGSSGWPSRPSPTTRARR